MGALEVAPVEHVLGRLTHHGMAVRLLRAVDLAVEGIHPGRAGNVCDIWHVFDGFREICVVLYIKTLWVCEIYKFSISGTFHVWCSLRRSCLLPSRVLLLVDLS